MTTKEFMLSELRRALLRVKLTQIDIEAIGSALKHDIITPEQAVAMMWDADAQGFMEAN